METDPNKVHYLTPEECNQKSAVLEERQNADPNFTIDLSFIKDGCGWYADVPTHTRQQNSMVAGADALCEKMANGNNKVTVKFRTVKDPSRTPLVTCNRIAHAHRMGGTYIAHGATAIPFPIWLCDVTHDVMGEHARHIYVYEIAS